MRGPVEGKNFSAKVMTAVRIIINRKNRIISRNAFFSWDGVLFIVFSYYSSANYLSAHGNLKEFPAASASVNPFVRFMVIRCFLVPRIALQRIAISFLPEKLIEQGECSDKEDRKYC